MLRRDVGEQKVFRAPTDAVLEQVAERRQRDGGWRHDAPALFLTQTRARRRSFS
jgi:hypothetical protein